MCFIGNDKIASLSEANPATKEQDLVISSAFDASVQRQLQVKEVKALASTSSGSLLLLRSENTLLEIAGEGADSEPTPCPDRLQGVSDYPDVYLSLQGPGLPSVMLLTNFCNDSGAIAAKDGASTADLIIQTL